MNLCARFLLVLILIALYGCSTNLYYIDKAIKTYPGPELPLDELSVLFHDTCLDQRMVLTQIDGQKIRTCSPIALLPGKHLLELVYRYEVTRAPFESRCSDPSKKPWECLGEITYAEVRQLDTHWGATWLILNVIYFRPPHRVGRQPLRPTYGNVRLP